ncbi:hypothetical protein HJG60_009286 [Phyllostomus discolor]|nr:hypothetical protein HJG60_009286 [Phyllostomus discolor]
MRLKSPAADMGRTSPGRRVPLGESLGPAHLPPRSCLLGQGSCHLTTGDHPRPLHKPVPLPAGPFLPPAFCPNPAFLRTWHLSRLEGAFVSVSKQDSSGGKGYTPCTKHSEGRGRRQPRLQSPRAKVRPFPSGITAASKDPVWDTTQPPLLTAVTSVRCLDRHHPTTTTNLGPST